ncbi:MAG: CheR family methyltransferase [Anaerolineae bacterium]|jgi:chemotaxis protein methyltransferase CheR
MDDADYSAIVRSLHRHFGLDLRSYKSTQMKRRLDAYLARVKSPSWADYLARLEKEPEERARLKDYLTINVTSFYRDADKFETLRREVLPGLLDPLRALRVWSAGCSDGAEPYTLAMLLHSLAPKQRVRIWATDIDRQALAKARAGGPYPREAARALPKDLASAYLTETADGLQVVPSIMRMVTFQEHNLLNDPVQDRFDLIVCRNVIIYFTEPAKNALFERFAAHLRPEGVLFIGATEIIPLAQVRALGLEAFRVGFYRRRPERQPIAIGQRGMV